MTILETKRDYLSVKKSNKLAYKLIQKNVKVEIFYGDLVNADVEVIVNAANTELLLGGGIAGAILNKCGRRVQTECDEYLKLLRGSMNVAEAMHTRAYNINAKHIIHACGPRWYDYSQNDKENCFVDLKNTFFNILMYAENKLHKVESIGVPLISSGIFGVPKHICCRALYEGLDEYLNESNDAKRTIECIKLINLDVETNFILQEFFLKKINPQLSNGLIRLIENETINSCSICKVTGSGFTKTNCDCSYCLDCVQNLEQNGVECLICKK